MSHNTLFLILVCSDMIFQSNRARNPDLPSSQSVPVIFDMAHYLQIAVCQTMLRVEWVYDTCRGRRLRIVVEHILN